MNHFLEDIDYFPAYINQSGEDMNYFPHYMDHFPGYMVIL